MDVFERLSPYNWDFRIIPEWLLKYTIRFEYLRSWPEFHEAAIVWLEKRTDGKSIRERLVESHQNKLLIIQDLILEEIPNEWFLPFQNLFDNPLYPVPTAWMVEQGRFTERKSSSTETQKRVRFSRLVDIRPMNKRHAESVLRFLSNRDEGDNYGYHMKIAFDMNKNDELVEAFRFWLKGEAKRKRTISVHGRASAPRWHRLKQLAAKRLSSAGLNYKDAKRVIEQREKSNPAPADHNGVLPKYNSHGAWHDAIKSANEFVETMKKNFHYENWELL